MMVCKRHRWRVGGGNAELIAGKIIEVSTNIWCERCNRKFKAYHHSQGYLKHVIEEKRGEQ